MISRTKSAKLAGQTPEIKPPPPLLYDPKKKLFAKENALLPKLIVPEKPLKSEKTPKPPKIVKINPESVEFVHTESSEKSSRPLTFSGFPTNFNNLSLKDLYKIERNVSYNTSLSRLSVSPRLSRFDVLDNSKEDQALLKSAQSIAEGSDRNFLGGQNNIGGSSLRYTSQLSVAEVLEEDIAGSYESQLKPTESQFRRSSHVSSVANAGSRRQSNAELEENSTGYVSNDGLGRKGSQLFHRSQRKSLADFNGEVSLEGTKTAHRQSNHSLHSHRRGSNAGISKSGEEEQYDSDEEISGKFVDRPMARISSQNLSNADRHLNHGENDGKGKGKLKNALSSEEMSRLGKSGLKISKRAEIMIRLLAKQAVRRQKIRNLWLWAIQKVIRMIKATNSFSTKTYFDLQADLRMLEDAQNAPIRGIGNTMAQLSFQLETYRVTNKTAGNAKIMSALMTQPENRTLEEIESVYAFLKTLNGFSKYTDSVKKSLSLCLRYSRFNSGRTIVKQDHYAENYYYILSGTLEMAKHADGRDLILGTLEPGMAFGEIALLEEEGKRIATISVVSEAELLWIMKDDFQEILQPIVLKEIEERKRHIQSNPLFSGFGEESINTIALTSQTYEIPSGTLLLAEGDIPSVIYVICEGECLLTKIVDFAMVRVPGQAKRIHLKPLIDDRSTNGEVGWKKVRKLVRFARVSEGYHYGSAHALAYAGTPNQIATINSMCDISLIGKTPFSIVSATKLKVMKVNRLRYIREVTQHPHLIKYSIDLFMQLRKFLADTRNIQKLYLERRVWDKYKKSVMTDIIQDISCNLDIKYEPVPINI